MESKAGPATFKVLKLTETKVKQVYLTGGLDEVLTRLINGSSIQLLAKEFAAAHLTDEEKNAIIKVSLMAAVSMRKAVKENLPDEERIVLRVDMFELNGDLNFSKLALVGHVLLHLNIFPAITEAWQKRLGAKSVFEATKFDAFTSIRGVALANIKAKAFFTEEAALFIAYKLGLAKGYDDKGNEVT
jgi:hypothetical protein